jgi:hypothetical protein
MERLSPRPYHALFASENARAPASPLTSLTAHPGDEESDDRIDLVLQNRTNQKLATHLSVIAGQVSGIKNSCGASHRRKM